MVQEVVVYTLGATALQKWDPETQKMELRLAPEELLGTARAFLGPNVQARLERCFPYRSGAELTFEVILEVAHAIVATAALHPAVLLCGTDTMDEAAFTLHLLLGNILRRHPHALVLTGAMQPADQPGSDGPGNLRDAITVAADPATASMQAGVLVCMNGDIHLGQYVFKGDSQLAGAFHSHPGPCGHLRGGRPHFYYAPPPSAFSLCLPSEAFEHLQRGQLRKRVAIWTCTVSAFLPEALLEQLDGLVLAGSGTGSLPSALVDLLSPKWTDRLPIVISSRCGIGANCDDFYYRGSRQKYESRGFILGGGYEHLSPLQARTLLTLRLSTHGKW